MPGLFSSAVGGFFNVAGAVAGTVAKDIWRSGALQAGTRLAGQGALRGASLGATVGGSAAEFALRAGTMGGISLARGAADLAVGSARTAYRAARFVGGGRVVESQKLFQVGGMQVGLPQLTGRLEDAVLLGGLAGSVGLGAWDYYSQGLPRSGWQVTQAAVNGHLEIEDERFLGATGSLTLALHRSRRGNHAGDPAGGFNPRAQAWQHLGDDALMMASRMF